MKTKAIFFIQIALNFDFLVQIKIKVIQIDSSCYYCIYFKKMFNFIKLPEPTLSVKSNSNSLLNILIIKANKNISGLKLLSNLFKNCSLQLYAFIVNIADYFAI